MIYDDIFKGAQQRRHLNLSPTPATLTIRQIVKICLGTLADQFFPKQVYLWGSILEKNRLDTLVGALGLVGRGFGPAGRAGLGWA